MPTTDSVKRYREKLGHDVFVSMNRSYTQKKRQDPEYYEKEKEKNRLRNAEKRRLEKIKKQNDINTDVNNQDDIHLISSLLNLNINLTKKKSRGRPKMTDEQKEEARLNRLISKI